MSESGLDVEFNWKVSGRLCRVDSWSMREFGRCCLGAFRVLV